VSGAFLDTNVVVYAFDEADPAKRQRAIEILEQGERLVVSTQVLLETWWVLTRRLAHPLEEARASEVIDSLSRLPVVPTDIELVKRGIATARRFDLAIWDAMIVEAARSFRCCTILSEDLQSEQDFEGVLIENPFTE
jgi:predicted nucleic acid-binding protein